ncbi:hypothetical protein GOODEAATRI_023441 [Goodea atripinnis]|uniref:Uncharacterized protein n=1 Tax=Goodea atripinnis TaxID=208336 RepID=A0ABV0P786_9TELE
MKAIQLPALQYQHERRSHDWTTDDASSISGLTDVTDFTDMVANTLPNHQDAPLLRLALSRYGPTRVPVALQPRADLLASSLANTYTSQLLAQLGELRNITDYVLTNAKAEGGSFNERCVVGAAFLGRTSQYSEATAYFNNQGYHTPATALMMVDNALFKVLAGPNASILTGNYPMPRNLSEAARSQLTE